MGGGLYRHVHCRDKCLRVTCECQKTSGPDQGAQWLEQVFRGKDYGLTIVSHTEPMDIGIYARPDYYFQYDNPAFQTLMTDLRSESDPATRSAMLQKAQTIISEDYVNGFLFELAVPTVANAKIRGLWENAPTQATDLTGVSWSN